MVVAALQPWAEISERLRRFVTNSNVRHYQPPSDHWIRDVYNRMIVSYLNLNSLTTNRDC